MWHIHVFFSSMDNDSIISQIAVMDVKGIFFKMYAFSSYAQCNFLNEET